MSIRDRKTGWLDESFHSQFNLLHLHTLARYRIACPVFVLMPDHIHLLWTGLSLESDQRLAIVFLKKFLNERLDPLRFQKQSYDHVLRESERDPNAFAAIAHYILDNPVRKRLVEKQCQWPFSGCLFSGYPKLNVHDLDYWERFWRIYYRVVDRK